MMQTADLRTEKSTQLTGNQHRAILLLTLAGHSEIWGSLEETSVPQKAARCARQYLYACSK